MKKVLCFGDSNTFGFIPDSGKRYKKNERWSGILSEIAKNNFKIIEAGCNNRTCVAPNPMGDEFVGCKILPKYLTSDIDIVILALGINDVQFLFDIMVEDIKNGMEELIITSRKINPKVEIIVVSPSCVTDDVLEGYFSCQFDQNSIEKSKQISEKYFKLAEKHRCKFIDLNEFAKVSKKDGLHFEKEEHEKIANKIYEILNES